MERIVDGTTYLAEIFLDKPETEILTQCSNCDWVGTADETQPIKACALTPGDPSPIGRCPVCESLAYIAEGDD